MPFFDGLPFHFDNSPAWLRTRQTLVGLNATMSASSIMNVSRYQMSLKDYQDINQWLKRYL